MILLVERIILRKVDESDELILDMVSTPNFVLKSVDWGTVKATHNSYKYVNQVGVTIANTLIGARDITIEGWLIANNQESMKSLKRRLNFFVNPRDMINLIYSEYEIGFVPDESVRYSVSYKENNDIFCKFTISGIAPDPLFKDSIESGSSFNTVNPVFHFPLVLSKSLSEGGVIFGKRVKSLIMNFVNKGSTPVGIKIKFSATGEAVNPRVINIGTQEVFAINKTLVDGEEIEVNTSIGEKRIRGKIGNGDVTNYFMYKDINSSWLQLDVGKNYFSYEADSGAENLDVFISFYNRYMEVQECV